MAKYREYFDIDPEYFPQVNKDIIESQPDLWKKFYPHETFVRLVKDTISILSRKSEYILPLYSMLTGFVYANLSSNENFTNSFSL